MFVSFLSLIACTIAHAAPISGASALQQATSTLGVQPLRGYTSTGRPCLLSFEGAKGGLILGQPVLGTYSLQVKLPNGSVSSVGFYFSTSMETRKTSNGWALRLPLAYDNEDPETGHTSGRADASMYLVVGQTVGTSVKPLLSVSIRNGYETTCVFAK